jgi:hypothetical protein
MYTDKNWPCEVMLSPSYRHRGFGLQAGCNFDTVGLVRVPVVSLDEGGAVIACNIICCHSITHL